MLFADNLTFIILIFMSTDTPINLIVFDAGLELLDTLAIM